MEATGANSVSWIQILTVGRNPRRTIIRALVLMAFAFFFFRYVLIPIRVVGVSMLPTYQSGRVNFVNRLAFVRHEPERGDVVAVRTSGLSIMLMKRVVALPGETIAFTNGVLYIDGTPLKEPYLSLPSNWTVLPETVRPNHYYVVGDNRSMSHFDHEKGQAERRRIVGKVLL